MITEKMCGFKRKASPFSLWYRTNPIKDRLVSTTRTSDIMTQDGVKAELAEGPTWWVIVEPIIDPHFAFSPAA